MKKCNTCCFNFDQKRPNSAWTYSRRKAWKITFMSLHLSKPAEWSWMLFGKGLRAMKKAKKWPTRLDLWMCTTASHIACESTRVFLAAQSSFPVGMQPLHLMVGLLWETPVQHKHACMQSTVNLKSNRTPITAPCVPAHRRDWMDDTDEELYRLKASKPHCNNHPCRSGCLQQWFQQFPQLFSRCSIKIADYHFKLAVWAFCKLKTATNPTIKIKSTFLTILCFQRENVLVFIF